MTGPPRGNIVERLRPETARVLVVIYYNFAATPGCVQYCTLRCVTLEGHRAHSKVHKLPPINKNPCAQQHERVSTR